VSVVVIDDHLLGDVIGGMVPATLATLLRRNVTATTNLYYYRLCRAALAAGGGALTGSWSPERREQAARALVALSPEIEVMPIRALAFRMAELARDHQLSVLGAEAVAAAEAHSGSLCVWEGDDGRNIRTCCEAVGVAYLTIARE
jgi:surface antigen